MVFLWAYSGESAREQAIDKKMTDYLIGFNRDKTPLLQIRCVGKGNK